MKYIKHIWIIKLIRNQLFLIFSVCLLIACEQDLAELNIDPNKSETIEYGAQLLSVQSSISGEHHENQRGVLTLCSPYIQHSASIKTGNEFAGGKYEDIEFISSALWMRNYPTAIKNIVDLVNRSSLDEEDSNFNAIARIVKVLAFQRLTDLYGDIPYTEAGLGYLDANVRPKFDTQEFIYFDMLAELENAALTLDINKTTYGASDIYYEGDVEKWKKFAYSLMLRLGMRLSEVAPEQSKIWVLKAIEGGVFESNYDIAYSKHFENSPNGISYAIIRNTIYRLSATLIDWLKETNDPRLDIFAAVPGGGEQKGLPNEIDALTIGSLPHPNDINSFSIYNPKLIKASSPMLFQTYAEVNFLIAEAIERGWYEGNAEDYYNKGVHAGMTQWSLFGDAIEIPDIAQIQSYLQENPYNAAEGLEMIGRQYWLVTFLNEYESYANWRRTDFPKLIPVVHPLSDSPGLIPTRFPYPYEAYSLNNENVLEAVNRLGEKDNFNSKVWWDN